MIKLLFSMTVYYWYPSCQQVMVTGPSEEYKKTENNWTYFSNQLGTQCNTDVNYTNS